MKSRKKDVASLSELVSRFSKFDVIAEMEKEYQSFASKNLPLSFIDDNSYIKRVHFPKARLDSLGASIREKGVFSPLLVREKGSHYELILGRKRYFGAKAADLKTIPVIVSNLGDEEMLLVLLADTRDQRESNILEMAYIYNALSNKFQYSQQTLAKLSHESRSQVTNTMRLLSLPDPIIKEVSLGELSFGHARALLSLSEEEIISFAKKIHEEGLSVRETEELVRKTVGKEEKKPEVEKKGLSLKLTFENEKELESFLVRNSLFERD